MATKSSNTVYACKPFSYHGSIPVFSEIDAYIENYRRISEDHLKSFYQTGENPFIPEYIWQASEKSTIALIEKYAQPDNMILDVGVGLGRLLAHFPQLNRYGNDISFGYLEEAQRKGIEVCFSKIEDLPYKEELFDIVVCTDVLEHVFDLHLVVGKILKVLKKGGLLIVRVPYKENLAGYLNSPYEFVHLRNFDEYSLRLLLEKVFQCECVEVRNGAHLPEADYLKCSLPYIHRLFTLVMKIAKRVNKKLADRLLLQFYNPIVINFVFRKNS